MITLALFGTSADPPTKAHEEIVSWLSQEFDAVAIWASDNPFKSHQTPLCHRSQMLQLLIENPDNPRDNLYFDAELSQPRTLETVRIARQKWPEAELYLVIGSDLIPQLPRWYQVEELLSQVNLLVVPRPGAPIQEAELDRLRELGASVAIADLHLPDVSSTVYRQTQTSQVLTPPVARYIQRENLYAYQDVS
ncbi:nicotinate-nucleotide adenylyltransferase [Laspinema sp. A4]|uniref:nicotinate-nucleotide adenylyltransferase n=1 Tax=Laspinema sp. D2d TaxID=2953686 RepID=UPI0021BB5DD3|nr:nicotinate-nucleotide adenylyltransferase [Laspinema sp. D2d]MCT7981752.1 nicotinate-nucleotide adenylyltransferase [Laspinema sp. D2d]